MGDIQVESGGAYNPAEIEGKWYSYWETHGFFAATSDSDKEPHAIMMPPPNVTGALHMGHALQDTVQDVLTRLRRMQGFEALWMPGKDHAGIATQNIVERHLMSTRGTDRHDLGREEFVAEVWKWVEEYGGRILQQKRRIGDSCDWSRERFTMDERYVKAVQAIFVRLYEDGLIYRGNYLVNWCPVDQTALSDEEVDNVEQDGKLWHVRYPFAENSGPGYITVATTRPETILGDTAVAVHPDDARYEQIIGQQVVVPLVERTVPVIADTYVRPEFGAGALKITPGHDKNDFEIGQRHGLDLVTVLDTNAVVNANGGPFAGLDRFEAREKIVEELKKLELLEKVEPYRVSVPVSQRSMAVIEPLLSRQWFVRMKPLAEPAIAAVRQGAVRFFPKRWENEFFRWMTGVRDWCISRQLWWGHRVPVWYHPDESGKPDIDRDFIVAVECPEEGMIQDEDVLDTWFSSWLFPFATLGWPGKDVETQSDLRFFHPTQVLVSGYDILFFWISRMIMASLYVTGEVPFRDILITGMIKDRYGQWMSKSLGNGVDPIEMIEQYGADAVRYKLTIVCAQGQDIKLHAEGFERGRNFCNKIWNAFNVFGRYLDREREYPPGSFLDRSLVERWMVTRINQTIEAINADIDRYRLNEALAKLHSLFWGEYCDWYLELIKPSHGEAMPDETVGLAARLYERLIQLLHPFMPYITEELWHRLKRRGMGEACMVSAWPQATDDRDEDACAVFSRFQKVVTNIRSVRSRYQISPARRVRVMVSLASESAQLESPLRSCAHYFHRIACVDDFSVGIQLERPKACAVSVTGDMEIFVPLTGLVDMEQEQQRLTRALDQKLSFLKRVQGKLNNAPFMERAPADVVERERQKARDADSEVRRLRASLEAIA